MKSLLTPPPPPLPHPSEWYRAPSILIGLIFLPVIIFNWDTAVFYRRNNDNSVQYAVKNHDVWAAKKKLLLKEFLPGALLAGISICYVYLTENFGSDGDGENFLPPAIAAVGCVPYTISAVFKAWSCRVDRSTRRARRTQQSKRVQVCGNVIEIDLYVRVKSDV